MVQWARWLFLGIVLGFTAWVVQPAFAQSGPARKVIDDADLFSDAAKAKANAQIAALKQRVKKDLLIETVPTVKRPKGLDKTDKKAVNAFFDKWANDRFKNLQINGVYVGIVKVPPKFRVAVGKTTTQIGLFSSENRRELQKILFTNLKAGKFDDALVDGTNYVVTTMTTNAKAIDAKKGSQKKSSARSAWPPWMGYLCIGLVVFLVIWLVVGLFRSFGGGGGYGGGGYGGGGGFFPGLLGGLFGAMAGMWLYNNVFGGSAYAANDLSSDTPDAMGDDYGTDVGQDADVGGDDYGGGDMGDDDRFNDGGGDWGGGDDFGGGDFGGGDFGGGDW